MRGPPSALLVALLAVPLAAACGAGRASLAETGPEPARSALALGSPPPAAPALAVRMRVAFGLARAGDLVQGRDEVAWIAGHDVLRVRRDGLALDQASSESIARVLRAARESELAEVRLHAGNGWILSYGSFASARTLRIAGTWQLPIAGNELVLGVAPLEDGRELWMIALTAHGEQRLAVAGRGVRSMLPLPPLQGPEVPGLSELAAPRCATPFAARVAGDGRVAAALVVECHRDAPTHIVRLRSGAAAPEVRGMSALGFDPEAFGVLPDGRAVIAGTSPSTIAREAPDGSWERGPGPRGAAAVVAMSIASDGSIWVLALGAGADGHDRWWIERDGAPVELADPDGGALVPRAIARHPDLGIVAAASAGDEYWLLAER